jgi:mono/diheme cytochrome c family protein
MLRFLDRGLEVVCAVAVVLFVVALVDGPGAIGAKKETPQAPPGKAATSGAQVFASAGCGSCHTLKAANASGSVGPNLDQLRPDAATVAAIVRSGGGAMPSFDGKLNDAQINAVARYVSSAAGR